MKGNKLEDRPGQIFNMDESGVPLDPKAPRLIFQKGSSACALGSGDKSQITVVACASAAGFCLPPMVMPPDPLVCIPPFFTVNVAMHYDLKPCTDSCTYTV